jgi:hypothetical protein
MKLLISKIASLFLALLVLVSTLSFTVDAHYCGNILIDKAILSQAESCGMHQEIPTEENSDCCDDELKIIKGQDTLKLPIAEFDIDKPLELAVFSLIHFSQLDFSSRNLTSTEVYNPPQYHRDFQILHQVFRI